MRVLETQIDLSLGSVAVIYFVLAEGPSLTSPSPPPTTRPCSCILPTQRIQEGDGVVTVYGLRLMGYVISRIVNPKVIIIAQKNGLK